MSSIITDLLTNLPAMIRAEVTDFNGTAGIVKEYEGEAEVATDWIPEFPACLILPRIYDPLVMSPEGNVLNARLDVTLFIGVKKTSTTPEHSGLYNVWARIIEGLAANKVVLNGNYYSVRMKQGGFFSKDKTVLWFKQDVEFVY